MMNSFISWIGGKKILRKHIINNFPIDFENYIEVFGGAGWVLFGKEPSKFEVFNDIDSELINLYRVIKYHSEALQKELDFMLISREEFLNNKNKDTCGLTDIQRAARYFYIIKSSFGANKCSFGAKKIDLINSIEYLTNVSKRLKNVIIENKNFENIIEMYDKEKALFYCDPPYYLAENYYTFKFKEEHHKKLNEILRNIKGKFILSYNDSDYIRNLYKDFNIIAVERQNNLLSKTTISKEKYKEIIVKNY